MIKVFDDVNISYFKEIESKVSKGIPITDEETNYYLSYIVYSVRSKIFDRMNTLIISVFSTEYAMSLF